MRYCCLYCVQDVTTLKDSISCQESVERMRCTFFCLIILLLSDIVWQHFEKHQLCSERVKRKLFTYLHDNICFINNHSIRDSAALTKHPFSVLKELNVLPCLHSRYSYLHCTNICSIMTRSLSCSSCESE